MSEESTVLIPMLGTIDLYNIPKNLEEEVSEAFRRYTFATGAKYTHQDKLSFIDTCNYYISEVGDAEDEVSQMIKSRMAYKWDYEKDLMDRDEIFCPEFMEDCFNAGQNTAKLYKAHGSDAEVNERKMILLYRIIKVVIEWDVLSGEDPMDVSQEQREEFFGGK